MTTMDGIAALKFARTRNFFCRVGTEGRALAFYTGDESAPATWLEIGKVTMTDNGQVSRDAVDAVTLTAAKTGGA